MMLTGLVIAGLCFLVIIVTSLNAILQAVSPNKAQQRLNQHRHVLLTRCRRKMIKNRHQSSKF